jgi:phage terminase small subunit
MALRARWRKFIDEYFRCNMDASKAYMRVYPKAKKESAFRLSSLLLKNIEVSDEITRRLVEAQMPADEVLQRLSEQAKGAHSDYITENGDVDIGGMVEDGKAYLIRKVKKTTITGKDGDVREYQEIEFYDSQRALEIIGKYHSLFVERVDHTTKGERLNIETMKPSEIAKQVADLLALSLQDGK